MWSGHHPQAVATGPIQRVLAQPVGTTASAQVTDSVVGSAALSALNLLDAGFKRPGMNIARDYRPM